MAQAVVMAVICPSSKNTILFGVPRVSRHAKCFPFQIHCSAKETNDPSSSSKGELSSQKRNRVTSMLISTAAVGMLLLSGVDQQAIAAPSGGRIGGQSFRSSVPRAPPRAAPSPRINNSRTNIYINPPSYGYGYGFGNPFFGGGWGLSPFSYFFRPGPAVAVGGFGSLGFLPLLLGFLLVGWVSRAINKRRDDKDDF